MTAVKIILRKEEKKDGTYPLAIRVTKNRKSSYIYLDYSVKPEDWDYKQGRVKKSHPNSARLNNLILKKLSEANDHSLELETQKVVVSPQAVRQKIKPSASNTFFVQAEVWQQRLKEAGKYNQYTADKPRIKHFKEFLKQDIAFADITVAMLERFKAQLITKHGHSERSAVNHIVMIRSVFSHAIKEGVIDAKHYPFGKGKMKIKFPESSKIGLTQEEINRLETVALEGNANHARNLWLFSYYFAGMRISDVLRLKWSDFQNDRLHYEMGKNSKSGSLKIPDKAINIIDHYKAFQQNKNDFVFPELKGVDLNDKFITQRTIAFKTSSIDKTLKTQVAPLIGTDKKLTMHLARHSFAQVASDKIPVQILQKLYRHSSILTTMGYQSNFTTQQTDDALDAVLNMEQKPKP
ncbi:site-specific integrase [Spirosoma sp. BT702]|uniref:Site-specific integrase n=1 Tax=Spirosoma profusum TaxID=2771354 RepID=A0A927G9Q4_9BACT|nr:site-specific integrase [Spirosoma profusum]MBD2704857.1 site-specific integrase [Spirosoma profusum]